MADFNAGMSAQSRLLERMAQGAADDAAEMEASGKDFNEPHLPSTDPFEYDSPRGDAPDVTSTSQDDETPTTCFWCGNNPADPEVSELYCSYACRDADHADNER